MQQLDKPFHFAFLLVPNYSMIAVSSAIEPLRMANQISKKNYYDWSVVTLDGAPVAASNGLTMQIDYALDNMPEIDALFVCSGMNVAENFSKPLKSSLCKIKNKHIIMGSLCTGAYILARSGLLDGYRCTLHWENMASFREDFPQIQISDELYEIDRDRYTSAGGTAPLDMMLQLISTDHSSSLANDISEQFMCDRIRGQHDHQRIPLQLQLGSNQSKLTEAVMLMEANIEEPISLEDLSHYLGVSRRQLERLFRKYLDCVPTRYYMNIRLKRARLLLLQTNKSIIEIALACGFVSAPHFSKCYRDFFAVSPREERQKPIQKKATSSAEKP
jgi:AraC family transcriptional regulator, glycine betaine-responsive activator